MIQLSLCRWSLIGLIIIQLMWFGFMVPMDTPARLAALGVSTVPLLIALPLIWSLQPRPLVITGLLLLFYFSIGISEAWANPDARLPAVFQVAMVLAYFTGLATIRRQRSSN
ncbi:MAG: DUF2069 domain-containing protein [Wenzhouxiangella sp.]|jgi:uncharacterized membrane protein|nr:DUF2069 domain-containing protein [Wenzhouxiangella sp.]